MTSIFCLAEQKIQPAFTFLPAAARVTARPLVDLTRNGWEQPLLVLGDELNEPGARQLIQRAYRSPAPLLMVPPLPVGDISARLDAPAPVSLVRQRADTIELTDETLQRSLGRGVLRIYCAEAIETALKAGVLATAGGRPVIWAYQPTRAATPVVVATAQLMSVSARTDPLDREDLLSALLAWAEAHTRASDTGRRAAELTDRAKRTDPALLRALVVAWAVHPDLTIEALTGWLREKLGIGANVADLEGALGALKEEGALDTHNRPQVERLAELADAWGLRAWVREARREDQG